MPRLIPPTDDEPQDTPPEAPEDTREPEATPEPPAADDEPQDDADDPPEGDKAGREAARYRRRLRETEAERDTLREQLTAMQRAEVERVAGQHVTHPAALWAAGTDLAELLTDAGTVDPDKVGAAVTKAAETLGLTRHRVGVVPTQGTANPSPPAPSTTEAMTAVIQGRT